MNEPNTSNFLSLLSTLFGILYWDGEQKFKTMNNKCYAWIAGRLRLFVYINICPKSRLEGA